MVRKIDTPLLFPIYQVHSQAAATFVIVSDPLDMLSILSQRIRSRC